MPSRRSTIVTLITGGSGLIVILVAGLMLGGPIRERWHVLQLTSSDARKREAAAHRVAAMGSVKAIPQLMRSFSMTVGSLEDESGTGPFARMKNVYAQKRSALVWTSRTLSLRAVRGSSRRAGSRIQLTGRNQASALDSRLEELAREVLDEPSASALLKIAKGSGAAALPLLLLELESEKWEIRWLAVHVLAELDSEEAAAAIRSRSSDPNEHVLHAANAARARRDEGGEDGGPGALRTRRGF